jgi:hypothetical protein
VLTDGQIQQFVRDGYVRLEHAFPRELAEAAREILWRDTGCDPHDRRTWTTPVVRLDQYGQAPFRAAASAPALREAFDQLVGRGRWLPRQTLGTFPIRFPSVEDPGDAGWHVDASFGIEAPDFMDWRVNVASRGRALLMLFLFSDVGMSDAPTRLRLGSHRLIARLLAPRGDAGMTLRELVARDLAGTSSCPERCASGPAGTVYLCHPFLVHAAQPHHGTEPRFMAQPPLLPAGALSLDRPVSPVEHAIVAAL